MNFDRGRSIGLHGKIPVLHDGVPLSELFDFEKRAVSMRLLSDPEIFKLEQERLFASAWIALAHESEIPDTGDFVVRKLGSDGVIVIRDKNDKINVLLNACTHKGMEIERAECGRAVRLRCPYHGWTFDRGGAFVGAPVAREMYGDRLNGQEVALRAARVELFAGMIFATWDEQAPSLDDFLGDIKFYLRLMYDRSARGLEVVGPPQRWIIPANWKCAAEQFAGDAYHGMALHGSLAEMNFMKAGDTSFMTGVDIVAAHGHVLVCRAPNSLFDKSFRTEGIDFRQSLRDVPPHGMAASQVEELLERFDDDALQLLVTSPPKVGQIFPNCGVMSTHSLSTRAKSGPLITIRTWHPNAVDEIEMFSWTFVERDAPHDLREMTRRTTMQSFGSSGHVEQEDAEAWPSLTRVAKGLMGGKGWMRYLARGEMVRPEGWIGGGDTFPGLSKDDSSWRWWLSYYEFMTGDAWQGGR
jgi:phenylpropionate dioxygenase-like ring-hydroxylating dioxygenase large terminal subunit